MMTKFLDLFDNSKRNLAIKLTDFYDGHSKKYLEQYLNTFRKNAINKGMTPHTINLVKEVVDKSGMLFSGRPPVVEVFPLGPTNTDVDEDASLKLQGLLETASWISVFNHLDPLVRMLKTALLLVQYDAETKEVFFTPLTQANCAVNVVNRKIETLIYFTGVRGDVSTYRIWTNEVVQDLEVGPGGDETIVNVEPNPYSMIPVASFHDTNEPRDGPWNSFSDDLIDINHIVNLHMTDGAYAIAHAKLQTLFTNAQIQGSGADFGNVNLTDYGSKLGPRVTRSSGEGFVGGPGEAVAIETQPGDTVYLDYKGPSPDIEPLDSVIRGWFRDYARGWSVTIEEAAGQGAADSGFKLVVKEIPNMELRRKRMRMMEAGFKQLYSILQRMNEVFDLGLTPNTELFIKFSDPELPVDEKVTEDIWNMKIDAGRATIITYFMQEEGLTRQGAEEKVLELAQDKKFIAAANGPVEPTP